MASKKSKSKTKSGAVGKVIIAAVVAVAIAGGVCAAGYCSRNAAGKWFSESDLSKWCWKKDKPKGGDTADDGGELKPQLNSWGGFVDESGHTLNDSAVYAMPAAMAVYESVAPTSEKTAPKIEITCSHRLEFNNVKVDWQAVHRSENGTEMPATEVTVTPNDDGSLMSTLQLVQGFSEPIFIKAISRDGNKSTAECRLDYVKRTNIAWISTNYSDFTDQGGAEFGVDTERSVGTVEGGYSISSISYSIESTFQEEVKSFLTFDIDFKAHVQTNPAVKANEGFYTVDDTEVVYSMYINNFDSYDAAHKEAIYYAWWAAFSNGGYSPRDKGNVTVDVFINITYGGRTVANIAENDLQMNTRPGVTPSYFCLTGESYGDGASPSLTLNKTGITL